VKNRGAGGRGLQSSLHERAGEKKKIPKPGFNGGERVFQELLLPALRCRGDLVATTSGVHAVETCQSGPEERPPQKRSRVSDGKIESRKKQKKRSRTHYRSEKDTRSQQELPSLNRHRVKEHLSREGTILARCSTNHGSVEKSIS